MSHVFLKMMKVFGLVFLCLLGNVGSVQAEKIKVVATFSILADMVKNVAHDNVEVFVLVGDNGDVHEYEPTPQDTVLLNSAQLIFENGLELENWLDKMYAASGSLARRVVVSNGIKVRSMPEDSHEIDPHAWQDIGNGIIYTRNIARALKEIDPFHAEEYEKNAAQYIALLKDMDTWGREELSIIKNRAIVTNHDALGYFADHYDLKVVGAVIPSATTEASDPSAKQMAQLIKVIKANHVRTIFAENVGNVRLAHNLAEQTGVMLVPSIYTDALGDKDSSGSTYVDMMRSNITIFKESLK